MAIIKDIVGLLSICITVYAFWWFTQLHEPCLDPLDQNCTIEQKLDWLLTN